MAKFNVGDRVRVKPLDYFSEDEQVWAVDVAGEEFTVTSIRDWMDGLSRYYLDDTHNYTYCEDWLELVAKAPLKVKVRKATTRKCINSVANGVLRHNHADMVNHPPHYTNGGIECIDAMRASQGDDAVMNFCVCNAFKYIFRAKNKNGLEDLKKAHWYIDYAIRLADKQD